MEEIDIPQYFLCPISLQIMKDPVTTVTGITYDRESIEQWLAMAAVMEEDAGAAVVCPVTKQPLPQASDLTPNHMLRRLIQAWCIANANSGIDRIPTPKSPLNRSLVLKLVRDVNNRSNILLNLSALKKLEELVDEGEKNQKSVAEISGVVKSMVSFILRSFKDSRIMGIDQALRILQLTWLSNPENKQIVENNLEFIESVLWILNLDHFADTAKTQAVIILKNVTEIVSSSLLERLNPCFFKQMVQFLRKILSPQATRSILRIFIQTSQLGRNKTRIIEADAVYEVIEMELNGKPDKKTTELVFCLLAHLCSCADGRQQLLKHAAGIAVVAKRLLRVSAATDDSAMCVFESIARFAASPQVVAEMLRVGGVSKLCMVLQADCGIYLKKKAREILRLHNSAWSGSPCIQVYLFTRFHR